LSLWFNPNGPNAPAQLILRHWQLNWSHCSSFIHPFMLVGKQVPHLIYWPNGFSAFDQSFKSSYAKKASKGGFF